MSQVNIHPSRYAVLQEQFELPYFSQIKHFLLAEKQAGKTIYPAWANIFKAFDLTPWDKVKVVILWQDPYHGVGQAMGLSFSVPEWVTLPPSLKNIYKELELEGLITPDPSLLKRGDQRSGDLTRWAEQWVLLLNSILTVRAGEAASHSKIGWQQFTDEVIRTISEQKSGVVFLLRGNYSIGKKALIDQTKHHVLTSVHPSPLSAYNGWFGCNHFRLCNEYLEKNGNSPIQW